MAIKMRELFTEVRGIHPNEGFYAKFKSSGAESMKVNGSVTPVVFTLEDLPEGQGVNTFTLISGRWDFSDTFGENGSMVMDKDIMKITIRDDMTGVNYFKVACHGILLEEN